MTEIQCALRMPLLFNKFTLRNSMVFLSFIIYIPGIYADKILIMLRWMSITITLEAQVQSVLVFYFIFLNKRFLFLLEKKKKNPDSNHLKVRSEVSHRCFLSSSFFSQTFCEHLQCILAGDQAGSSASLMHNHVQTGNKCALNLISLNYNDRINKSSDKL